MGPWFGCFNGFGIGGGWIMMFLWTILIGVIIYLLVKAQNPNGASKVGTSEALDIAKARLARGEISSEEFENIKKTLK